MSSVVKHFDKPLSSVFEACPEGLTTLGWTLRHGDETKGTIEATTSPTIFSWGENLDITLKKVAGGTDVLFISEPAMQLFDWGKSSENVGRFLKELNKLLG